MGAKLHGQGPRAEADVARRLPRILLDSNARSAAAVTPRRYCSAQALQRRIEAGPWRLQRLVRRRGACDSGERRNGHSFDAHSSYAACCLRYSSQPSMNEVELPPQDDTSLRWAHSKPAKCPDPGEYGLSGASSAQPAVTVTEVDSCEPHAMITRTIAIAGMSSAGYFMCFVRSAAGSV